MSQSIPPLPLIFSDFAPENFDLPTSASSNHVGNNANPAAPNKAKIFDRAQKIDAILPQTQCGLCGYPEGCLPYAHAVAAGDAPPNLCVPGGDPVAFAIAAIVQQPPQTAVPSKWQINPDTHRPEIVRAVIDEAACIGCTKCLPACPVDAIVGTAKHMHTVIMDLCTGCELCVAPCPVDCIDIVRISDDRDNKKATRDLSNIQKQLSLSDNWSKYLPNPAETADLRRRYYAHLRRLEQQTKANRAPIISALQAKMQTTMQAKLADTEVQDGQSNSTPNGTHKPKIIDERATQSAIAAARMRAQISKLQKQLAARFDEQKAEELALLQALAGNQDCN